MSNISEIKASQFQFEVLDYDGAVLVDFYGADCVICEAVARWFDEMDHDLPMPVKKIFLDGPESSLAETYRLRGIPTLIRFEYGIEIGRMAGEFSLDRFREFVLAQA